MRQSIHFTHRMKSGLGDEGDRRDWEVRPWDGMKETGLKADLTSTNTHCGEVSVSVASGPISSPNHGIVIVVPRHLGREEDAACVLILSRIPGTSWGLICGFSYSTIPPLE